MNDYHIEDEYPIEDEYAYHITNQIVEYFRKLGFEIIPVPISRNKERQEGYDWRYQIRELKKVFMLQFKRPNPRNTNISWELKEKQHEDLRDKRYVFYCLPKSKERDKMRVMLYSCLFKRATFPFTRTLKPSMLKFCDGWGSFALKVLKCEYGVRIRVAKERDVEPFQEERINFEEPLALFALSPEKKKMKIVANEKILKPE